MIRQYFQGSLPKQTEIYILKESLTPGAHPLPKFPWQPLSLYQKKTPDGKSQLCGPFVKLLPVMSLVANSDSEHFPEAFTYKTIEFHFSCAG